MPHQHLLRNRALVFGFIATMGAAGSAVGYDLWKMPQAPKTVRAVLPHYGFKTAQEKAALSYLMTTTGIKDAEQLLNQQATNQIELAELIFKFIEVTQKYLTIRTATQERWDVETKSWMENPAEQQKILDALETLKMLAAVAPTFKQRDAICILGARKSVMVARLDYAGELFAKHQLPANWLVLLAGERYVTYDKNGASIDGSQQELLELSKVLEKDVTALTETDLIRAAYLVSKLFNKLPTEVIDTPRGDLPRPTTETTVIELCNWLRKHREIKTMTFVSNQPHVEYQKAIIAQVFKQQGIEIKFEVIGPENKVTADNKTAKIKETVGSLGSQLWADTPQVLEDLGIDTCDPRLSEQFKDLFKKQPLIYKNFEKKCKPNW